MKRIALAVVFLGLVGCGSDDPLDDVVGAWQSPISGFDCARALTLRSNQTFVTGLGCTLQGGGNAAELHSGTYTIAGDTLAMTQSRSSCPGDTRETVSFTFARDASNLTLRTPDGAVVFAPLPGGPSQGGSIQLGCFDDTLAFQQSPEHDLQ